jgi:hypothetical protein
VKQRFMLDTNKEDELHRKEDERIAARVCSSCSISTRRKPVSGKSES